MSRFASLACAVVALCALSGCDDGPTPQEAEYAKAELPGCIIHDLGHYGAVSHLIVVTCDGRATATSNWRQQIGKTSVKRVSVTLQATNEVGSGS